MDALIILHLGLVLMFLTEDFPVLFRRFAWIVLVIAGIVMGALERLG